MCDRNHSEGTTVAQEQNKCQILSWEVRTQQKMEGGIGKADWQDLEPDVGIEREGGVENKYKFSVSAFGWLRYNTDLGKQTKQQDWGVGQK